MSFVKPNQKSFAIIVSTDREDLGASGLLGIVTDAATKIAGAIDDNLTAFDVDVIEGTFDDVLSGDNVQGLGHPTYDLPL